MLTSWSQYNSTSPETPSQVLSQFLLYRNYIKIEDAVILFEKFLNRNIKILSQFFVNGRIISWANLKEECDLTNDMFFYLRQLKHAIPTRWKTLISTYSDVDGENFCRNHHFIKVSRILSTN